MSVIMTALARAGRGETFHLGPIGHLTLFLWALALVILIPMPDLIGPAVLCLLLAAVIYPQSLRRMVRWRILFMLALLILPPLFFLGERNQVLWGIAYSEEGVWAAGQFLLRFAVMVTAVDGFTHAVDITQLAGFIERLGLRGLGFTLGVALNLLPSLQQSSLHAWQSLQMRGGLRRKKWRGLRLVGVTIMTNALRRAEEISMAAEGRAFSPYRCPPPPLKTSFFDGVVVVSSSLCVLLILLTR